MKEFDLESYKRKYAGTKAVFRRLDSKGSLDQAYVDAFDTTADNGRYVVRMNGGDKIFVVCSGQGGEIEFEYHPIESGVYFPQSKEEYFYVIQRKINKTFQVGLGHGFTILSYDYNGKELGAGMKQVDLLSPVKRMSFSKHKCGVIDRHFWWKGDKLYWNLEPIAVIKDEKNILVSNKALTKSIKAIWGNECRIQELPSTST